MLVDIGESLGRKIGVVIRRIKINEIESGSLLYQEMERTNDIRFENARLEFELEFFGVMTDSLTCIGRGVDKGRAGGSTTHCLETHGPRPRAEV